MHGDETIQRYIDKLLRCKKKKGRERERGIAGEPERQ